MLVTVINRQPSVQNVKLPFWNGILLISNFLTLLNFHWDKNHQVNRTQNDYSNTEINYFVTLLKIYKYSVSSTYIIIWVSRNIWVLHYEQFINAIVWVHIMHQTFKITQLYMYSIFKFYGITQFRLVITISSKLLKKTYSSRDYVDHGKYFAIMESILSYFFLTNLDDANL